MLPHTVMWTAFQKSFAVYLKYVVAIVDYVRIVSTSYTKPDFYLYINYMKATCMIVIADPF